MKRIWASWRMKYISSANNKNDCFFCNVLTKNDCSANLVVMRSQRAFIVLNKYPYTSGHVMVAPFVHKATLEELDAPTRAEMMELASLCTTTLRKVYNPQGFNLGANIGEAAGAGVPGHVHLHIVPRWNGDTNFITTVGEVRVLPESLEETYRRIKEALVPLDGAKN
jgi:ATP adenylyltransferase